MPKEDGYDLIRDPIRTTSTIPALALSAFAGEDHRRRVLASGFQIHMPKPVEPEEPVFAYRFEGTRYDCGSKLGYLKATVDLGRKHAEVGVEFDAFLREAGR